MKKVKRNILLNPGPATTTDTVKDAMFVSDICPREKEFCVLMQSIMKDLVKVVNGGDNYVSIMFAASGTGGDESAICSAVPKDKKLLVIDNGAYGSRLSNIAKAYNIQTVDYKLPYGDYIDINKVAEILDSDQDISHIAVVHHETTTGMLNPVREIIQVAHKRNVEVIVDAISSYAAIPIDANQWEIDYLVSTSNKNIQGMAGLTFIIVKKQLLDKLKHNTRSLYFDLYSQYQGFVSNGQMRFTPPVQILYALRQALDEFFIETQAGRTKRYFENWEMLYEGVKKLGFKFLLPYHQESKILMAVIEPNDKNYSFEEMHDYLYEKGFTIYPGKGAKQNTFRLAVIGDLHPIDIKNFLQELQNYLNEKNITQF